VQRKHSRSLRQTGMDVVSGHYGAIRRLGQPFDRSGAVNAPH
jgi:hypothetical protein